MSLTRINHIQTKYPKPWGRPAKPGLKLSSLKATCFRLSYSFWKCSDFENTEHLHFPILTIGKCKKKKKSVIFEGEEDQDKPSLLSRLKRVTLALLGSALDPRLPRTRGGVPAGVWVKTLGKALEMLPGAGEGALCSCRAYPAAVLLHLFLPGSVTPGCAGMCMDNVAKYVLPGFSFLFNHPQIAVFWQLFGFG